MRWSQRFDLERKLSAAEEMIARRAMSRVADLLEAQTEGMPLRHQHDVMLAVKRASESGAEPRNAVRVLLAEIAHVDAALAARIGRAVGIAPSPSASSEQ
jgi:hypothetical protein